MSTILLLIFFAVVVYIFMGVNIVPQSQVYLVEKLGRYNKTLEPGLNLIIPFIENVRFKVSILERQLPSSKISAITKDNASIEIEMAVLYRISEAARAFYRIQNVDLAIVTTVTGVVRNVIGRTEFDGVQVNRSQISESIEKDLSSVMSEWGIALSRVEIVDVEVDAKTKESMQLQLNAERTRRALVTEAEGNKQSAILVADAELYSAKRNADAKKVLADADAYSLDIISSSIKKGGSDSVNFEMRKLYADAIKSLGNQPASKIVVLPTEILDTLSSSLKQFIK